MTIPRKYEDVVAERDAALAREAALREELATIRADRGAEKEMKAKARGQRDVQTIRAGALQQRLAVAEQRVDCLEELLNDAASAMKMVSENSDDIDSVGICMEYVGKINEVFKPAAEPTTEAARKSLSFENQRVQPARFHCLACGEYHEGSGSLPCPKMKPMSGVKP